MDKTLIYLEQISENLNFADYEMIYRSIADMRDKSAPATILKKGHYIDRVRINRKDEIFICEDEISYIKDQKKLLGRTEYGRANLPEQAMFYGAVESTLINMPRAVAYFETSDLFWGDKLNSLKEVSEVFTHSRWRVQEDIELLEIIYSDEALKVNPDVQAALKYHTEFIKDHEKKDHFEEQMKFFSNQFARIKRYSNNEYKISCAYSNYILATTHLGGVAYPSVASEYKGQNIVLKPTIVDQFLKLESLSMSLFERKNYENQPIVPIKICKNLGKNNQNFVWEPAYK